MKQSLLWFQQQSLHKRGTILSFVCLLYVFIFSTPPFTSVVYPEKNVYWHHISKQMNDPFLPIERDAPTDHEAKLAQRLLVPVIGYMLPTDDNRIRFGFLILLKAILGFFFFRILYIQLSKKQTGKWIPELMTFGLVTLYLGKSFISDYMWFDEFAFFLTIIALFNRHALIVIPAVIGACFTDERAYFSLLFVFCYKLYTYFRERNQTSGAITIIHALRFDTLKFLNNVLIIPLTMLLCIGIRVLLAKKFGLVTSVNDGGVVLFDYLKYGNIDYLQLGLFAPYKVYWVFIFWSLCFFWKQDKLVGLLMLFALLATTVVSLSVWDLSRSLTFSFPLLIISYLLLQERMLSLSTVKRSFFYPATIVILAVNFIITPLSVSNDVHTAHNFLIKLYERKYR